MLLAQTRPFDHRHAVSSSAISRSVLEPRAPSRAGRRRPGAAPAAKCHGRLMTPVNRAGDDDDRDRLHPHPVEVPHHLGAVEAEGEEPARHLSGEQPHPAHRLGDLQERAPEGPERAHVDAPTTSSCRHGRGRRAGAAAAEVMGRASLVQLRGKVALRLSSAHHGGPLGDPVGLGDTRDVGARAPVGAASPRPSRRGARRSRPRRAGRWPGARPRPSGGRGLPGDRGPGRRDRGERPGGR